MNSQLNGQWLKISLNCPEIMLEPMIDILGVLSGSGVEQTPVKQRHSILSAFFQLDGQNEQQHIQNRIMEEVKQLFDIYNIPAPTPEFSLLADQNWATSWQQFFKPFHILPGMVIKPTWEEYIPKPNEQIIEMDPGMAFGTGQHASTHMALEFIHTCYQNSSPTRVLDVGTGTGILAMAAALFGRTEVIAIDNDPVAIQVATENISHNDLQDYITCSTTPLDKISGTFALICANIIHDVLVSMAKDLSSRLKPGGYLILAGILQGDQEKNIEEVYKDRGITLLQKSHEDEWAAFLLQAPDSY